MENSKPLPKFLFPLLIIIILASMLFFWQKSIIKKSSSTKIANIAELAKATSEITLNRTFDFKVTNPKNEPIVLKYTLVSAKKVRLITQNNQPVKIKSSEEILIVDLELQNNSNYSLKVNSRDFMRLSGTDDKKYAPDFYNEEQNVAPISVKKDQVAFIVNKDQQNFKLQVGEINKEKTDIDINLK